MSPAEVQSYFQKNPSGDPTIIWRRFGLPIELKDDRLHRRFDQCADECEADIFPQHQSWGPERDVFVRVCNRHTQGCRFLFFKTEDAHWLYEGFIDGPGDTHYAEPEIRFVEGYVVLNEWIGSGTGVAEYIDRWYRKSDYQLLFTVPERGHLAFDGVMRRWSARAFETENDNITFIALIHYWTYFDGEELPLFDEHRKIIYARSPPGNYSVARDSEMTARDMHIQLSVNREWNPNEFLRFTIANLLRIARGPETTKKSWLRDYLTRLDDTPEKRRLLQALASSPKR